MNLRCSFAAACIAALVAAPSFASDPEKALPTTPVASSSSALPDAPVMNTTIAASGAGENLRNPTFRPFSALAIGVKIGIAGVGFDVATPLSRKLNLRGSASFFNYSPSITEDGLNVNGTLKLKSVNASLDFYPAGGSFRISPGVTMYNGNTLTATALVPGGSTFTLNDTTYYSNVANPVTGQFNIGFGNRVAPSLTMGWGNMIPRKSGQHWSVPFEVGFQYIGTPTISLALAGTACQGSATTNCGPVNSGTDGANLAQEQQDLQNDISALRFYPIVSIGLSYKFGSH